MMSPFLWIWFRLIAGGLNLVSTTDVTLNKPVFCSLDSEEEMDTTPAPASAKKAGMVKAKEESEEEEDDDDDDEEEDEEDEEGEFK